MTEAVTSRLEPRTLDDLARLYGVQTSYTDLGGTTRTASPDALLAVMRALEAPVERLEDVEEAVREREEAQGMRLIEPVTVLWEGEAQAVDVQVPGGEAVECRLTLETGEELEWTSSSGRVTPPAPLPLGYHDLTVAAAGRTAATRIIVAPRTVHDPEERTWGVFLPLYALRTRRSWGTGDFGDLEALLEWTSRLGGSVVGTLPLLSAFLDTPFDPSPYAPVSRLFWNELYVDLSRAPQLAESAPAQAALESEEVKTAVARLRQGRLVDYRAAAAAKRAVLEPLAQTFFAGRAWRAPHFQEFLAARAEARTYAAFRATCERRREPWRMWPDRLRTGTLRQGDYDAEVARYHLYVQWLAEHQLAALAATGAATGGGLYLDLPLGVHPDGYDVWRFPRLFASRMSAGAPPDDFFAGGQDWGFPPLHPERIREDGYAYVIASIRTLLRHSHTLRLDHVMSLHRLFWVPWERGATEGVYVRYRFQELWAILCLESRRHRTAIVGEDLGTVPPEVREAIDRHHARRMYVVPFELRSEREPALTPVPARSVASLGTHDLPPFAAHWDRLEPERREALVGALTRAGCLEPRLPLASVPESKRRRWVLRGGLRYLAASPARVALVSLEDLWQEKAPQNVPGTTMEERPNWRRKARYQLETFTQIPEVVEPLEEIDVIRRQGVKPP